MFHFIMIPLGIISLCNRLNHQSKKSPTAVGGPRRIRCGKWTGQCRIVPRSLRHLLKVKVFDFAPETLKTKESLVKILMRDAETLEGVFTTDKEKVPCRVATVPAASNGDSLQH